MHLGAIDLRETKCPDCGKTSNLDDAGCAETLK